MSKQKDPDQDECKLEMTPMIDVTFLLLIFFLCTLRFKTLEGKLTAYLPRDVGRDRVSLQMDPIEVVVTVTDPGTRLTPGGRAWDPVAGGRWVWSPDRRLNYRVGPWETSDLGVLESHLRSLSLAMRFPGNPAPRLTLDAHPGTVQKDVVEVLDRVLSAGYEDVAFVGARPAGVD